MCTHDVHIALVCAYVQPLGVQGEVEAGDSGGDKGVLGG